jgi:hypothetical protein
MDLPGMGSETHLPLERAARDYAVQPGIPIDGKAKVKKLK